jgi:hypothetical protein
MKRGYWIARGVRILVMIAVVLAAVSFLVMTLWNWLVPPLFGGPMIRYVEALGLLVLARLLFGGFRPHGRGHWGHSWHHARAHWEQMTPEERERFRSRFGGWHRGGCRDPEAHEGGRNGGNA